MGSEDFLLFIAGGWGRRIFVIYRRGVGSEDFCSVTIKLPDSPIMLYNILMIPSNWPLLGSLLSLAPSLYSVGEDWPPPFSLPENHVTLKISRPTSPGDEYWMVSKMRKHGTPKSSMFSLTEKNLPNAVHLLLLLSPLFTSQSISRQIICKVLLSWSEF